MTAATDPEELARLVDPSGSADGRREEGADRTRPSPAPAADGDGPEPRSATATRTGDAATPSADDYGSGEREPLPDSVARLVCLSVDAGSADDVGTLMPEDAAAVRDRVAATDRVTEAAALLTCHRIEIYAATRTNDDRDAAVAAARDAAGLPADAGTVHGAADAVEHLARVAAGLESPVVGEPEIMGQVSDAVADAADDGHLGGALGRAADAAVRAGRTVRERTAIDEGQLSYGSVVCTLVDRTLEQPPDGVLLIGAGAMADTAATAARRHWDATVDVANRSSTDLATADGEEYGLDELRDAVAGADAVVAATGAPTTVVDTDDIAAAAGADPLPVVDLARPADVPEAAADVDGVVLHDLDDVTTHIADRTHDRRCALEAAEALVADGVARFVDGERENRAEDVLRAMHRDAAATRDDAVARALDRLDDSDADPERVIEDLASSLTGRLLAAPTDRLRAAARDDDADTIAAARQLFDLRGDGS